MGDKVRVGDWVRFYRDGKLVLGVVNYIRPRKSWESDDEVQTDNGAVSEDGVLEIRRVASDPREGAPPK